MTMKIAAVTRDGNHISAHFVKSLAANLQVFLTGGKVLQAVQAYLQGMLINVLRRVHAHNHQ